MQLISAILARANGLTRYYTGEPCKRGHVAERAVSSKQCIECGKIISSAWRKANRTKCSAMRNAWAAANRERSRAVKNAWNKANPEPQKARSRKWYEANKDKNLASCQRYRETNPDKVRAAVARWNEANPHKATAIAARRRAAVLLRTPAWANHEKIEAFYEEARALSEATGLVHHVDHIIPLQGKAVSGLHVETNLQILPAQINRSKSNRFEPVSLAH